MKGDLFPVTLIEFEGFDKELLTEKIIKSCFKIFEKEDWIITKSNYEKLFFKKKSL
mgnify:CR=1 FL=1